MPTMAARRVRLSDQIRRAVDASEMTRYRIAKDAGIDHAVISRFMAGKVGLSMATLDDLADVLGLNVTTNAPDKRRRRKAR